MNNYEEIATAMSALAAEDFIEGFKNCAREFGTAFLADGFAVRLPDPENKSVDVGRYQVAATGRKLPRSMCLYFDARDFFLGSMFSGLFDISGEDMVKRLTEQAISAVRHGRHKKPENTELKTQKKNPAAA